jgi:hypothetical protein
MLINNFSCGSYVIEPCLICIITFSLLAEDQSKDSGPEEDENDEVSDDQFDHHQDQPRDEEVSLVLGTSDEEECIAQGEDKSTDHSSDPAVEGGLSSPGARLTKAKC